LQKFQGHQYPAHPHPRRLFLDQKERVQRNGGRRRCGFFRLLLKLHFQNRRRLRSNGFPIFFRRGVKPGATAENENQEERKERKYPG
jgi:hypothetical protein